MASDSAGEYDAMSSFYWPEPDLEFLAALQPQGESESRYYVCHGGNILQSTDSDGQWRPLTAEELKSFRVSGEHYMGRLGDTACVAVLVDDHRKFTDFRFLTFFVFFQFFNDTFLLLQRRLANLHFLFQFRLLLLAERLLVGPWQTRRYFLV